jgi:hypothetical protein
MWLLSFQPPSEQCRKFMKYAIEVCWLKRPRYYCYIASTFNHYFAYKWRWVTLHFESKIIDASHEVGIFYLLMYFQLWSSIMPQIMHQNAQYRPESHQTLFAHGNLSPIRSPDISGRLGSGKPSPNPSLSLFVIRSPAVISRISSRVTPTRLGQLLHFLTVFKPANVHQWFV